MKNILEVTKATQGDDDGDSTILTLDIIDAILIITPTVCYT